jgi:hypothetical protein
MPRSTAADLTKEALDAVATAFDAAAITVNSVEEGGPFDAIVDVSVDDRTASFVVEVKAYCTGVDARSLIGRVDLTGPRTGRTRAVPLLVADRITAEAREILTAGGWSWLDRRGRLHLRAPAVRVDLDLDSPTSPGTAMSEGSAISGRGGISVAYWLCGNPGRSLSPTRNRAELSLAPSTISTAVSRLTDVGLVDDNGAGVFPELFWELAARWRPERTWIAARPDPSAHTSADPGEPGWRLSGSAAAAAWGAPIVTTTGGHLELYVRRPVEVSIAIRRYGATQPGLGAAALAVAATTAVVAPPLPGTPFVDGWPAAPLVAVALDLAQDPARGREILQAWEHPDAVWR